MRHLFIVLVLSLVSPLLAAEAETAEPVYIDVRSWSEYQLDHIDGDTRIHVSEIVAGVRDAYPDKSTEIYLYCASGGRAGRAAEQLQQAGYQRVHNAGGIADVRAKRGLQD